VNDGNGHRYTARLAASAAEVRAAQRLRYEVFVEEMGARLASPLAGHEVDEFDVHCEHVLVYNGDEVVGSERLLPPGRTDRLNAAIGFDLGKVADLRGDGLVEATRLCVRRGHRNAAVMGLLWQTILRYMVSAGHRWIAGCCTVTLDDGGAVAAGVVQRVALGPERYRVTPRVPWRTPDGIAATRFRLPSPLGGYLRLGAWLCGPPAYDPEFAAAEFFVLLPIDTVNPSYLRHWRITPAGSHDR
jgi:putative hemolysin